jgi:glycosyltransferase involved in cell wall biosynthesis
MPCFNATAYVREAIGSVFAQTDSNFELIAVDDNSTDDTAAVLAALAREHGERLRVFSTGRKSGPFPARNLGLEQARGELVAFLDSDDWWDPSFLARLRRALEEAGADLTYCGWQNVGKVSLKPYVPPRYEQSGNIFSEFLRTCPWPIHAVLMKRSLIQRAGGFSTYGFSAMDYDLWLKIVALSQNFVRVPEVLAYYRWHDQGQVSASRVRQVMDAHRARLKFVDANRDKLTALSKQDLRRLLYEPIRDAAFVAYWKRDQATARFLFRKLFTAGYLKPAEAKYGLLSQLPAPLYRRLFTAKDQAEQAGSR